MKNPLMELDNTLHDIERYTTDDDLSQRHLLVSLALDFILVENSVVFTQSLYPASLWLFLRVVGIAYTYGDDTFSLYAVVATLMAAFGGVLIVASQSKGPRNACDWLLHFFAGAGTQAQWLSFWLVHVSFMFSDSINETNGFPVGFTYALVVALLVNVITFAWTEKQQRDLQIQASFNTVFVVPLLFISVLNPLLVLLLILIVQMVWVVMVTLVPSRVLSFVFT